MRNKIKILLLLFLTQCGYTTVYDNKSFDDFNISIISMEGDKKINNLIKSKLKKYSNRNLNKEFKITIITNYKKKIITKDITGKAEDFELKLFTEFQIDFNGKSQKFSFNEKLKIKNSSNSFELRNYENVIKDNFVESIKDKLILKLKSVK